MAKTKISELEKMVGVDRKEIISFLNENGIEAKNAASSVDDDSVKLVKDRFGKSNAAANDDGAPQEADAAPKPQKAVPQEQPSEASTQPAADKPKTPVKVVVKKVVSTQGGVKTVSAAPQSAGTPGAAVKKRKVIIVKGGSGAPANGQARPANNYVSGVSKVPTGKPGQAGGQNRSGQQRSAQGAKQAPGKGGAQAVYRPINPKTVPTQMTVDFHKPVQTPQRPVRQEEPVAAAENIAAQQEAVLQAQETAAVQAEVTAAVQESVSDAKTPFVSEADEAPATVAVENAAVETKEPAAPAQETPAATPQEVNSDAKTQEPAVKAPSEEPAKAGTQTKAASETSPAKDQAQKAKPAQNAAAKPVQAQSAGKEAAKEPAKEAPKPFIVRPTGPRIIGNIRMNTNPTAGTGTGRGQSQNDRRGSQGQAGRGQSGRTGQGQTGRGPGQGAASGRDGGRRIRMNDAPSRGAEQGSSGRYNARPGQGGGARPGQGGSSFGDNANKGGNRRNQNNSRDKRGRKDFAMEEMNERRGRAGRFIKPAAVEKAEPEEQIKVISIPEKLTIRDLAERMHMQPAEIIKKLFLAGKVTTVNTEVTYEEAENIASDYDILCEKEEKVDVIEQLLKEEDDSEETLKDRPPVICVMGHVDHGKTSLLDYIRKTKVTAKEAGGITQAIGAYTVDVNGRSITFLDTPGHEAFTAMRMRGAQSTDIAVLVVAADDGVMPQTVEAINHAKAAGVEIVVAVNKIDKPEANPDRVKQQLAEYGLQSTDWGGSTEFVNVSAKSGEGIEDLLETILLTADVLELKANPDRNARGLVLEAKLDKGRGPVANVLVQKGTLHVGDFISAGAASGKVRAMINDRNEQVKSAGPSTPVVVLGLNDVPSAGEVILAHDDDKTAKSYAQTYKTQHKEELLEENKMSMNVEDLFDQMREGKLKQLDLIVKADVQGSVEALCSSLLKLSNEEVMVKIIHSAAGNITESDVSLASASNAAIIGFNVKPDSTAASIAEHSGVSIHLYKVIYEAIDAVDAALKGMLAPVYEEKVIGHAEVRQIFKSGKIGNIAGSYVLDGQIERGCMVRITRAGEQIFEGSLASLKRFKDDAKEVKAGYECGLVFEDFDAMNVEDIVEAYKMVEVPREELAKREASGKKS